jgi:hypothetical protein
LVAGKFDGLIASQFVIRHLLPDFVLEAFVTPSDRNIRMGTSGKILQKCRVPEQP